MKPDYSAEPLRGLRRSLTPAKVLALTLAALSPAASVFVTGSAVLHLAGTGVVIAVLAGGCVVMILTALYAELGAAFPHAGGVYHGIGQVLGARARAGAMALGLVTAPALLAFAALGLSDYVSQSFASAPPLVVANLAICMAIGVGLLRMNAALWLTSMLLALELLALAVVSIVGLAGGLRSWSTAILHPVVLGADGGLISPSPVVLVMATIASAYACSGSNLALHFSEEVEQPSRVAAQVVLTGGAISIFLVTVPLMAITIGAHDLRAMLESPAPIAAALQSVAGPRLARLFALAVVCAIFDHIVSALIAYSRFGFASARSVALRWPLFRAVARGDTQGANPVLASIAIGVVAMALTLLGERNLLILLSGELVTPALVIVAVLIGRRRAQTGHGSYRAPLYPVLPMLGLTCVIVFLAADLMNSIGRLSLAVIGVITVVGATSASSASD